jgi:ABC-2 type transport system permease protein
MMTLNDLRIFVARPGNWIGLVLVPILLTVGLGFAFSGGGEPERLRVDIFDEDGSAQSLRLRVELAAANSTLLLCPPVSDENRVEENGEADACGPADAPLPLEQGQERVREGESDALIVIPAGYGEAVATLQRAQVDYYSTISPPSPDPVLQTLNAVMSRVNSAALTAAVADAFLARFGEQAGIEPLIEPWRASFVTAIFSKTETLLVQRLPAVRYEAVGGSQRNQSVQGFAQTVPGIGSLSVMITVLGGMVLIQRERQRGTLQRLGVFPLTRGQILAAKILTYFTLGMLQYLIVFAVGLVVGLDFGPNPLLLLLVMAAFVLCCTALTFAIAPSLHSEGQANVVTQLLSLTLASLGGAWWPLEIVPEFMQQIAHLTPVAWAMDAFQDLLFYGGGAADIAPEMAVLLAAAAVIFGMGIWRFRYV